VNDIDFRIAEQKDLTQIIALLANDPIGKTRETSSIAIDQRYLSAFEAIGRDDNQLLGVAAEKEMIVGCMQLSFIPGLSRSGMWRGQIEGVRVAKSHRGSGMGRRFFEWALDLCRERGCGLVQLSTDKRRKDAQEFYRSLGFVASHKGMKLVL